jgi:sulfur carrier protein ThiS
MAVHIELTMLLRKFVPNYDDEKGILLENAEGKTISEIMKDLGIPSDKVFNVLVNRYPSKPSQVVRNGDLVTLGRVIGGG